MFELSKKLSPPAPAPQPTTPTIQRVAGRIEYRHLAERTVARPGVRIPGRVLENQHADVIPNVSIVLHGRQSGRTYERTFRLGDLCEYELRGIVHYGRITAIGERTVSVYDDAFKNYACLELPAFSDRNWAFDEARARFGSVRVTAK